MIKPHVTDQIATTGAPLGWAVPSLVQKLLIALRAEKLVPARSAVVMSISCVTATRMIGLNFKYRRQRRTTDVLSFEQPGATQPGVLFLGDLVLCIPVVRAQAREHGHGVRNEAAVLLIHGVLHLLGFDHERSKPEAVRMAKVEARLLRRLELGRASQKSSTGLITRSKVLK